MYKYNGFWRRQIWPKKGRDKVCVCVCVFEGDGRVREIDKREREIDKREREMNEGERERI